MQILTNVLSLVELVGFKSMQTGMNPIISMYLLEYIIQLIGALKTYWYKICNVRFPFS